MAQQLLHTHYAGQPLVLQPSGPAAYTSVPAPYMGQQLVQVVHMQQQQQRQPSAPGTIRHHQYSGQAARGAVVLGAMQIVTGLLSIVLQIICMKLEGDNPMPPTREHLVPGAWCGALFLMTGAIGIMAGKKNTNGLITWFMTFNIFSALFSWIQLGFAAANLAAVNNCKEFGMYGSRNLQLDYATDRGYCDTDLYLAWISLDAILMILANLEFITSVTAAAICCKASCGCCRGFPGYVIRQPGTTVYLPTTAVVQQITAPSSMGNAGQPYHVQGMAAGYPRPAVVGLISPPQYQANFTTPATPVASPFQTAIPSAPPAMLAAKDEPPTYDDAIMQ